MARIISFNFSCTHNKLHGLPPEIKAHVYHALNSLELLIMHSLQITFFMKKSVPVCGAQFYICKSYYRGPRYRSKHCQLKGHKRHVQTPEGRGKAMEFSFQRAHKVSVIRALLTNHEFYRKMATNMRHYPAAYPVGKYSQNGAFFESRRFRKTQGSSK